MRRVGWAALGFLLALGLGLAAVGAMLLFGVAVAGHYLATRSESAARTLSFDPSSVATLVPIPGAVMLALATAFGVGYLAARRADRRARGRTG